MTATVAAITKTRQAPKTLEPPEQKPAEASTSPICTVLLVLCYKGSRMHI
ncbi:hypothetical protein OESDEN_09862 [Oesophagostomum dentatum]|uniref:Uncharacterized protein n=1 Tax=Oesophagostomum dentatum TaxID=61180 RepID=A0A0B1T2B4_OESDE|nr:hypothetical protein OESDEN_09862 [Oesophagostomum dentatum]